jgi:uncharacterized protein YvpB
MSRKHNETVDQGSTFIRQLNICALLIVASIVLGIAAFPVTTHADTGPVVADGLDVLLAEVPLYSQLDNDGVEWTSCGPTSLAMALDYCGRGPLPQEVIAYATSHAGRDGEPLYKPHDPAKVFTSPQHLYEIAQHYGNPVQGWVTDNENARQQLRVLLADGLPVVVDVTVALTENRSTAAHFVTVTGMGSDDTVYVNDPYGEGLGGRLRSVAWEDFYWAWQNNGDGHVGGHGWWMVAYTPGESASVSVDELIQDKEPAEFSYLFSCDELLILADPLALSVDAPMCVLS